MLNRRLLMAQAGGTPPGGRFTRLNYLQGTYESYIDTRLRTRDVNKVEITFRLPSHLQLYEGIFGVHSPSFYLMAFARDNEIGANYDGYVNAGVIDTGRHTISISNRAVVFDGTVKSAYNRANIEDDRPLPLFARKDTEGITATRSKIFDYKAYKNDVCIQHLVPSFDNDIGRPCMIDLLTNTPYYNDGTGEFDYG